MSTLPSRDRDYLLAKGITFEEVDEGGQHAIIIRNYHLPDGRFDTAVVDILVILPSGYPDLPPDMFYTLPWVRLAANKNYPRAADVSHQFHGQSWQRWSRHCYEWRAGIDGIWTMLRRIEHALQQAAA